jgi:hypothetical protein
MQASQAKDSNVTLPRAVLRRSAAIEARIAERKAEPETPPADPNAPQVPPVAATTVETPPLAADPTPQADPRENDPLYWKQRFKVTEGVLRSERTQRQTESTETNRRLTELQEQVRTLKAATPKPDDVIDVKQFFTGTQIEQFGEEQCEAMARAATKSAKSEVQKAIEEAVAPLKEQNTRTEEQQVAAKKQAFTDRLAELVPNYLEIDVEPEWLAWLAQEDEGTGVERNQILQAHIHAFNAPRVAKVFADYLRTKKQTPVPPITAKGDGAGPSGDPPPQAAAGSLKAPSDAEVKDFFKRSALGKVKDAERVAFEARMKLRTGG